MCALGAVEECKWVAELHVRIVWACSCYLVAFSILMLFIGYHKWNVEYKKILLQILKSFRVLRRPLVNLEKLS